MLTGHLCDHYTQSHIELLTLTAGRRFIAHQPPTKCPPGLSNGERNFTLIVALMNNSDSTFGDMSLRKRTARSALNKFQPTEN